MSLKYRSGVGQVSVKYRLCIDQLSVKYRSCTGVPVTYRSSIDSEILYRPTRLSGDISVDCRPTR